MSKFFAHIIHHVWASYIIIFDSPIKLFSDHKLKLDMYFLKLKVNLTLNNESLLKIENSTLFQAWLNFQSLQRFHFKEFIE